MSPTSATNLTVTTSATQSALRPRGGRSPLYRLYRLYIKLNCYVLKRTSRARQFLSPQVLRSYYQSFIRFLIYFPSYVAPELLEDLMAVVHCFSCRETSCGTS